MKTDSSIKKLNRYTTIPVLLDYLSKGAITLIGTDSWDDINDKLVIEEYRKRVGCGKILAICFSHDDETVHHWKAFSEGISGCCIEFNAQNLFKRFERIRKDGFQIRHEKIQYKKIADLKEEQLNLESMPFIKRWPYRCESEYRVILESELTANSFDIEFSYSDINRITISQKMPKSVFENIANILRNHGIEDDSRIIPSTLYENSRWIDKFKRI